MVMGYIPSTCEVNLLHAYSTNLNKLSTFSRQIHLFYGSRGGMLLMFYLHVNMRSRPQLMYSI